jgi:hypothetical protein
MNEQTEARLDALLEAHERIAMDMGEHKILSETDPTDHLTGEREALLRVEELIADTVDDA